MTITHFQCLNALIYNFEIRAEEQSSDPPLQGGTGGVGWEFAHQVQGCPSGRDLGEI